MAPIKLPARVSGTFRSPALAAQMTGGSGIIGNVASKAATHQAIRQVVGRMPAPTPKPQPALSPLQQAQQLVSSELGPLEQQLTSSYTSQGNAGAAAIRALTAQYAAQMGQTGQQLAGVYQPAEAATAAADASLADRLQGAGNASSDELASRLASIQQPGAVNPVVAQIAGNGAASGNATYATGNASLDQLLNQAANAQAYATKLPGIAQEAGLQNLSGYEGQLATAEGKDLSSLQSQAPGLINSSMGTITSANNATIAQNQKAQAAKTQASQFAATQAGKKADRQATATYRAAQTKLANTKLSDSERAAALKVILTLGTDPTTGQLNQVGVAELAKYGLTAPVGTTITTPKPTKVQTFGTAAAGYWTIDPATGQPKQLVAPTAPKAPRPLVVGSDKTGRYLVDPTTGKRLAQVTAPVAGSKTHTAGSLTDSETEKLVSAWHDGKVSNVRIPAIDPSTGKQAVNSNGVPQYVSQSGISGKQTYQQAITRLVGLGKSRADATRIVNSIYDEPGQDGRPWLTEKQTSILASTGAGVGKPGRGANPAMIGGHAVLDPSQYAALKKANQLPEGQLTREGFYVIGAGT